MDEIEAAMDIFEILNDEIYTLSLDELQRQVIIHRNYDGAGGLALSGIAICVLMYTYKKTYGIDIKFQDIENPFIDHDTEQVSINSFTMIWKSRIVQHGTIPYTMKKMYLSYTGPLTT